MASLSSISRRLLAGALAGFLAGAITHASEIQWRNDTPGTRLATASLAAPADGLPSLAATGDRHFIAQLHAPLTDATRALLGNAGVELLAPLGGNAFFASLAPGADTQALVQTGLLAAVGPITPDVKVHPFLWSGQIPEWATVDLDDQGTPKIGVYILLHGDVQLAEADGMLTGASGVVRDWLYTVNGVVAELPVTQVVTLASDDRVQWIEPALPQLSETNAENRAITGANIVQAAPYNLNGAGVTVMVYDGGIARASHVDFNGRLSTHDNSGLSGHATHVSGTIGGSGTANANNRGMAPGVNIVSFGFQYNGTGIFLYTNPGDIEADYGNAINNLGADISNNSIGTNTETNGFPCSIQGDYGVTDQVIDSIVRGSLGTPFRVVWANGNERQGSNCDIEGFGDYYSTAPPATAKNHLTVGALNANNDSMTSFSSWGPTDDGRLKPDVSAPGCQSGGDNGVTSCTSSSDTAYSVSCGTSMASPTVCGLAALLLQDYRAHFPGPDPRNSTLRAFFAHNAVDLGNVGPDYQFGYGSVRIQPTIDFVRQGFFYEDSIGQGGTATYQVNVAPGTPSLKITIAWDDPPGTPNVVPSLINDLDVRAISPGNVTHFPWTLNPANPGAPAVQTVRNSRDNIEQVFVSNPQAGLWTIEVVGFNVPQGPQVFSICGGPNLAAKGLRINLPGGSVNNFAPGVGESLAVQIQVAGESLVPGSPQLHFRYDGGAYQSMPLTSLGGENYTVNLPPPVCGATPEYYVSAEGSDSGVVTNPNGAPTNAYSAIVGGTVVLVSDEMETNAGWTVGAPGDTATTGIWNRMDPQPTIAQPGDDHTPAPGVACWVTDGNAGSGDGAFDVDGGATTLTSPTYNLGSSPEARISYWRWYSNSAGGAPNADIFRVQMSNNNGASFTAVETVGPSGPGTSGGWINYTFRAADILPVTAQMRLRFIAEDAATGSLIEAAIDDLLITEFQCSAVLDDCNGNGIVDSDDIASGRSIDSNGNGVPDECDPSDPCPEDCTGDGERDQADLALLLSCYNGGPCCDITGDGVTDQADLAALLAAYNSSCP